MSRTPRTLLTAAAGAVLVMAAATADAEVTVIGNGLAAECSSAARSAAGNAPVRAEAIHVCTLALDEPLSPHETAATFVNRGVLQLAGAAYPDAMKDFDKALTVEPGLAEALVNRGAALVGEGRYAEAVAEITRGLARNPTEPEKAHFNRATAEERLGDIRSAYLDYEKALALKPDWDLPKAELARFRVVRR